MPTYSARYIVNETSLLEDASLEVSDGRVQETSERPTAEETALGDVAVAGGRVNAHSHAFQRAIRGRTEYLDSQRADDDFWSWREKMYRAALEFDADQFESVARFAFMEMLRAGFTTVGEFHYVHHDRNGDPYDDPNELAKRLIRAADDVGIRIVLLRAAYHRAGYDTDPNPRQRRFIEPDVDTYLARVDDLRSFVDDFERASVGLAPHSIRAVPRPWLEEIAGFASEHDLPVHIHASEQRGELQESIEEYGGTPIVAFSEMGLLGDNLTVVHATHASGLEIDLLAKHGCTVCACPTTERNLGDGFLPASELVEHDVPICVGSDSHANIDPWEEMRLIEYHERLLQEQRNVLATSRSTADALWPMGGANGARALHLEPATLEADSPADFVTVDLEHLSLAGSDADSIRPNLVFSIPPDAIRDVYLAGEPVIENGRHPDQDSITRDFRTALADVWP